MLDAPTFLRGAAHTSTSTLSHLKYCMRLNSDQLFISSISLIIFHEKNMAVYLT